MSRKKAIEEMKVPKGGKCGVLSCVGMFGEFSERAESIIMGGDRRSELDKAYTALIDSVFSTIERVAKEHTKTPADVIRFGVGLTKISLLCEPLSFYRELPSVDGHLVSHENLMSGEVEGRGQEEVQNSQEAVC